MIRGNPWREVLGPWSFSNASYGFFVRYVRVSPMLPSLRRPLVDRLTRLFKSSYVVRFFISSVSYEGVFSLLPAYSFFLFFFDSLHSF